MEDIEEDMDITSSPQQICSSPIDNQRLLGHKYNQALFLLKANHSMHLSYEGITDLCYSTESFVHTVADEIEKKVMQSLREYGVASPELMEKIRMDCNVEEACSGPLFQGLTGRHSREEYYKSHFNYVVSN